jgi:hypothetical protein
MKEVQETRMPFDRYRMEAIVYRTIMTMGLLTIIHQVTTGLGIF